MTIKGFELCSIQVGKPRRMNAQDAPAEWDSGVYKATVTGPVFVGKINLDGDGQADLQHHGGPDRPILMYSAQHYPFWRQELNLSKLAYGWFGENFTISGLTENTVCLGDTYQLGDVTVQISQPRNPCWKLARRVGIPDLVDQVNRTGKSGWYARVLTEGFTEASARLVLADRPCPELTITYAQHVWHERKHNPEAALALADCPYLSKDWIHALRQAAAQ